VLFHFTDSVHNLTDILSHEFRPHYSLEDFGLVFEGKEDFALAFPLISFCDIPLSQASQHMATYGNYAIGLSKDWGLRNGIAPVLYCYPNSTAAQSIGRLLELAHSEKADNKPPTEQNRLSKLVELSLFLKPYEGAFLRRGRLNPKVRFYDEREWRFVPTGVTKVNGLHRAQYLDFNALKEANERVREFAILKFEPSDIKYIIVATEAEILPMIHSVERIKEKYTQDERKILSSRIVSAGQILEDF